MSYSVDSMREIDYIWTKFNQINNVKNLFEPREVIPAIYIPSRHISCAKGDSITTVYSNRRLENADDHRAVGHSLGVVDCNRRRIVGIGTQVKIKGMRQDLFYKFVDNICRVLGVDRHLLFSKSKRRDIVDARHLLYYLCFRRMIRVVYIQKYMAQNDYHISHSSVIHGIKVASEKAKVDADYKELLNQIEQ
jgi:hypothetical protein